MLFPLSTGATHLPYCRMHCRYSHQKNIWFFLLVRKCLGIVSFNLIFSSSSSRFPVGHGILFPDTHLKQVVHIYLQNLSKNWHLSIRWKGFLSNALLYITIFTFFTIRYCWNNKFNQVSDRMLNNFKSFFENWGISYFLVFTICLKKEFVNVWLSLSVGMMWSKTLKCTFSPSISDLPI